MTTAHPHGRSSLGRGGEPACSPYNIFDEHGRLLCVGKSSPKTYAITAGVPASHSPDQRQLVMLKVEQ
jgi:hypothetical protein